MNSRVVFTIIALFVVGSIFGGIIASQSFGEETNNSNVTVERPQVLPLLMNNLVVAALGLIGPISVPVALQNGFTAGYIVGGALGKVDSFALVAVMILPHGVFEIPAILLTCSVGLEATYKVTKYLIYGKEYLMSKEEVTKLLRLGLYAFVLIVVAAMIESYVTPRLVTVLLQ